MYKFKQSKEEILKRMISNIANEVNCNEGTYTQDVLSAGAVEYEKIRDDLDNILDIVFIQNAYAVGNYNAVEMRAAEQGTDRKKGIKASGNVDFKTVVGTEIPKDFIVQTKGGLQYKTLQEITTTTEITTVKVEAIEVGSRYNVVANTIIQMPIQLVGILEVNNPTNFTGGMDRESIDDLYSRYLVKLRTPATSGNTHHYYLWAMETNGVGGAKVLPEKGKVTVVIIDGNKRKPTEEIINNCKNHINEERPVLSGQLIIQGAEEVAINLSVLLVIDASRSLEDVKADIENNVSEYIKSLAFKDNTIRYSRICNCVLNVTGVKDYSNLTVNSKTENIVVTDLQVPILGSVIASV